jgi:hypothetical protein
MIWLCLLSAWLLGCCLLWCLGTWVLATGCWLRAARCWLLAAGCWLLAAGCWLLAAGCWLLAACCLLPLALHFLFCLCFLRCLLLAVCYCLLSAGCSCLLSVLSAAWRPLSAALNFHLTSPHFVQIVLWMESISNPKCKVKFAIYLSYLPAPCLRFFIYFLFLFIISCTSHASLFTFL